MQSFQVKAQSLNNKPVVEEDQIVRIAPIAYPPQRLVGFRVREA